MSFLRQYPKRFFWIVYFIGLMVSLILDVLWLRSGILHYHFPFQYFPQFFAIFGLIGCMLLILIAKGMGYFISKDEDYYEKDSRRQV
jgi:hypothetical protein